MDNLEKPQQDDVFNRQNVRGSVFLEKDKEPEKEKEESYLSRCCACCQLSYYKDYFKVTNKDVFKRILCNLKFWGGGFFQPVDQEYDLQLMPLYRYGPFWLYTTMIFAVGAVHNVLIYENQPNNFQYDFKVIGVALTVFYIMGLGISALIGLIFGCMGLQSKTSQIVCLYGYSMATYIICILLCSVNMTLMTWLFLLYGAGTKIAYVLKNVFESLEVPTSKKFLITVIVIVQASLQLLIIKFAFIITGGKEASVFSHHMALPTHDETPFIHLRQFSSNL